jgi:hypothetical protein
MNQLRVDKNSKNCRWYRLSREVYARLCHNRSLMHRDGSVPRPDRPASWGGPRVDAEEAGYGDTAAPTVLGQHGADRKAPGQCSECAGAAARRAPPLPLARRGPPARRSLAASRQEALSAFERIIARSLKVKETSPGLRAGRSFPIRVGTPRRRRCSLSRMLQVAGL